MPLYEYVCIECGLKSEEVVPIVSRDKVTKEPCSRCQTLSVRRVPGCGGFRLKGRGWAKDGYSQDLGQICKDTTGWRPQND